jgi:PD-(D/E)XK nuclease superfamily
MDHIFGIRREPYEVPSYSLTGDAVAFKRCGLQYRLGVLGRLPSTRPIQLWFGEFIHGVMEEAFRRYSERLLKSRKEVIAFFDDEECEEICDFVERRLKQRGLQARSRNAAQTANHRAQVALQELAPLIFPLISHAEVKLTGTRDLVASLLPPRSKRRRSVDKYELVGIVDVITQLDAGKSVANALIDQLRTIFELLVDDSCEVIVDYKGQSRPDKRYRDLYEKQIKTYAYLREAQVGSGRVVGGALLFINELAPSWDDLRRLSEEIASGDADVVPESGSLDWETVVNGSKQRSRPERPVLSLEYRLRRALLPIVLDKRTIQSEVAEFDRIVTDIEASREAELSTGDVVGSWSYNDSDDGTCTACDFQTTCLSPKYGAKSLKLPS